MDNRQKELDSALEKYQSEMQRLNYCRLEICRQEMDAWAELKVILNQDKPKQLHRIFNDYTDKGVL